MQELVVANQSLNRSKVNVKSKKERLSGGGRFFTFDFLLLTLTSSPAFP